VNIGVGDIVKYEDAPCEVLCVFPKLDYIFLINKRTLCANFVHPSEVELVRKSTADRRK